MYEGTYTLQCICSSLFRLMSKNCVCNPNVRDASQSAQYRDVDYADEGMIVGGRGLARYAPGFTNLVHIDSSRD